ncbi:hypothetical protein [Sinomonas sp. G460-2]|uniref:hypothetical protein n=1 Tax=Sinomonas sp. G460-2 TaxID=3393464 RepID=UPI0039EEB02F
MLGAGVGDGVLGDDLSGVRIAEGNGLDVDDGVDATPDVLLAEPVDDVADADPPVGADGAMVFAGRGAGAADDVSDVFGTGRAGAAGPAVADVLGARCRPGVLR